MTGTIAQIQQMLDPSDLTKEIVGFYSTWNSQRQIWLDEQAEKRDYIFATDTRKTSNSTLPWKNKTTLPKLTQIRDSLHANYMSALFPNEEWMSWEAEDRASAEREKRVAIQAYLKNKLRLSGFRETVSKLLYDYIDYGNAFATVEWVNDVTEDPNGGEPRINYIGPKLRRISPYDILFNPTAPSFEESPTITRKISSMGELEKAIEVNPEEAGWLGDALAEIKDVRTKAGLHSSDDFNKAVGYSIDGFGNLAEYYGSGLVELLEFKGDIYDVESGKLLRDVIITVADRTHVVRMEENKSWVGSGYEVHCGWRERTDNIYAMGPLDNLVGMQYRIDHLENIRADVFDLIAFPPLKIIGDVEDFEWGPFARIHIDEGGDVQMLSPDTTALNADLQIARLEDQMEEFAGSPKETMGFRSPGEKTAFEVNTLITAAGRLFQEKIENFEIRVIEASLNNMLELSRRNLNGSDVARVIDEDIGVETFISITKEDISGRGKLRATGARHFIAQAQIIQNLTQLANTPIWAEIKPHISQKSLTSMVEDLLNLNRFDLFKNNVNVIEQAETARLTQQEVQNVAAEGLIDGEIPEAPLDDEDIV